jgi:hypothetical protein
MIADNNNYYYLRTQSGCSTTERKRLKWLTIDADWFKWTRGCLASHLSSLALIRRRAFDILPGKNSEVPAEELRDAGLTSHGLSRHLHAVHPFSSSSPNSQSRSQSRVGHSGITSSAREKREPQLIRPRNFTFIPDIL